MEDLGSETWFVSGRGASDDADPAIVSRLNDSMIQIEATLAKTTITLAELEALEIGDIITTDLPATAPISVSIEGRPKFEATLGQHRGQRAIQICDSAVQGQDGGREAESPSDSDNSSEVGA